MLPMAKNPLLPCPTALPEAISAELRRAERAYARGMLVLVVFLYLGAMLLHSCTPPRPKPAPTPAAHHTVNVRGWHFADEEDE